VSIHTTHLPTPVSTWRATRASSEYVRSRSVLIYPTIGKVIALGRNDYCAVGIQITRFGVASRQDLGSRAADQNGGYARRPVRASGYVTWSPWPDHREQRVVHGAPGGQFSLQAVEGWRGAPAAGRVAEGSWLARRGRPGPGRSERLHETDPERAARPNGGALQQAPPRPASPASGRAPVR